MVFSSCGGGSSASTTTTLPPKIYKVGDTGPGGGIVFFKSRASFVCNDNDGLNKNRCSYLEVAPDDVFSNGVRVAQTWTCWDFIGGTSTGIGTGEINTDKILSSCKKPNSPAQLARSYTTSVNGTSYNDWFLPSRDEIELLCLRFANDPKSVYAAQGWWTKAQIGGCRGTYTPTGGFTGGAYWSSSEYAGSYGWHLHFYCGVFDHHLDKYYASWIRAVRAF
jgi:hypothetical protein